MKVAKSRDRDPTRTLAKRAKWAAEMRKRFSTLKPEITKLVGEQNALGLGQPTTLDAGRFSFRRDPEKIDEFIVWLQEQIDAQILEMVPGPAGGREYWTNSYIRRAYGSGLKSARTEMRRAGAKIPSFQSQPGGVTAAFFKPFHVRRVELLYRRTWTDLEGVTKAMSTQMARVLASGMAEGIGPYEMARRLNNRVDKIGIARSRLIARTEYVESHNRGALAEYQSAEAVLGEDVNVQWWTAQDERVRSSHRARHGKVYTREEGASLLGDPNCRCALLPFISGVM